MFPLKCRIQIFGEVILFGKRNEISRREEREESRKGSKYHQSKLYTCVKMS
jgi:hypothetical protein